MLKLSLKPGEQVNIGEDVRVIYRRASASGIKIILDAPEETLITRTGMRQELPDTEYYRESWRGKNPKRPENTGKK